MAWQVLRAAGERRQRTHACFTGTGSAARVASAFAASAAPSEDGPGPDGATAPLRRADTSRMTMRPRRYTRGVVSTMAPPTINSRRWGAEGKRLKREGWARHSPSRCLFWGTHDTTFHGPRGAADANDIDDETYTTAQTERGWVRRARTHPHWRTPAAGANRGQVVWKVTCDRDPMLRALCCLALAGAACAAPWMGAMFNDISNRTLREFTLPGTHDRCASAVCGAALAPPCVDPALQGRLCIACPRAVVRAVCGDGIARLVRWCVLAHCRR
jgi:hypothetical protein